MKKHKGRGAAKSVLPSPGESSPSEKFFTHLSIFTLGDMFPACAEGCHMQAKQNGACASGTSVRSGG